MNKKYFKAHKSIFFNINNKVINEFCYKFHVESLYKRYINFMI